MALVRPRLRAGSHPRICVVQRTLPGCEGVLGRQPLWAGLRVEAVSGGDW